MLLLTSGYLVISDIVVTLILFYYFFEVVHSVQQSSPSLNHRLILFLHFKIESTGAKTLNLTLIASEKCMWKLQPSAEFTIGTNVKL